MAGSFVFLRYHLVWSTHECRPLVQPDWKDRLYGYMGGILSNKHGRLLAIGGMADHVHLEVSLASTIAVADAVNTLKANSSRWVHETLPEHRHFAWQEGYAAFTVSKSAERALVSYICAQESHHARRGYRSELLGLLKKHEIRYNEDFIWR